MLLTQVSFLTKEQVSTLQTMGIADVASLSNFCHSYPEQVFGTLGIKDVDLLISQLQFQLDNPQTVPAGRRSLEQLLDLWQERKYYDVSLDLQLRTPGEIVEFCRLLQKYSGVSQVEVLSKLMN